MRFAIYILLVVLATFVVGCSDKNESVSEIDQLGHFADGVYKNDFFGFDISLPDTWDVMDQETAEDNLKDLGSEYIVLLFASEYPVYSTRTNGNSYITITALDLQKGSGKDIATSSDFFEMLKQDANRSNMDAIYPEPIHETTIDGLTFDVFSVDMDMVVFQIKQIYYAMIINDYVLIINLSYPDDQNWKQMEDIIESIKFY